MAQGSDLVVAGCESAPDGDVVLRYRRGDGRFVDVSVEHLPVDDVLAGLPVREFRSYRGRKHYSGWYWSATTGAHVVYESRLELARILLADQAPGVVAIAAQPFLMEGFDGARVRRHVPDLLLGRADGAVTVVDVKPASRLGDPEVAAQFEWTRRVCDRQGWGFEVWSGVDTAVLENVRFLAGYRRPELISAGLVQLVLGAAFVPAAIGDLERRLAAPERRGLLRPAVLHLIWSGRLTTDLGRVLSTDAVVCSGADW